jgi:hypothetical protein
MNFKTVFYLFLICAICSCKSYVDSKINTTTTIRQGHFDYNLDYNMLIYRSNVISTRDQEKLYPKAFEVLIPKKIRYYKIIDSSDFLFCLDKKQYIYINIDLGKNNKVKNDTSYTIIKEDFKDLIISKFAGMRKIDINKFKSLSDRKHIILEKGGAKIWLYNIIPSNFNQYYAYLNNFKFID